MNADTDDVARLEQRIRDQDDRLGKMYSLLNDLRSEKEVLKMRTDQHEKFIWGLISIVLVTVAAKLLALL